MLNYSNGPVYRTDARLIALMIHTYYDAGKKIANPRYSDSMKADYKFRQRNLLALIPKLIERWNEAHGESWPQHWTQYTEGLFCHEVIQFRKDGLDRISNDKELA